METIISFFEKTDPILGALYATLFTWGLTALGASLVFFIKSLNRIFILFSCHNVMGEMIF